MSWFDIIVIIALLAGFINGVKVGLMQQLTGLIAIIVGAIFAGKVANIILPYILEIGQISPNFAVILSYIVAFIIIVIGIKLIGKVFQTLLEALYIGFINRILGGVLGVITISLFLSILVNLAVILDTEEEIITKEVKAKTYFYSNIQQLAPMIIPYLKEDVWEKHIQKKLEQYNAEKKEDSILVLASYFL